MGCEICDGPVGILGLLGRLVHLLCRDCGMQFSREATPEDIEGWNTAMYGGVEEEDEGG